MRSSSSEDRWRPASARNCAAIALSFQILLGKVQAIEVYRAMTVKPVEIAQSSVKPV